MNGFEILAQSYETLLTRDPDMDTDSKQNIERAIKNLRLLAETDDQDRDELFNSGAFNSICKGYMRKAMIDCGIDNKTINAVMDEISYLFNTMSAADARKF